MEFYRHDPGVQSGSMSSRGAGTIGPSGAYRVSGRVVLYIHGGGMAGIWGFGLFDALRELESSRCATICGLHGYSFGAILAVMYACGVSTGDAVRAYRLLSDDGECAGIVQTGLCRRLVETIIPGLGGPLLPPDAYRRCTGVVHIGRTVTNSAARYTEVSTFGSNDALVEALESSCRIPGVTAPVSSVWRERSVDGVFGMLLWGWPESDASTPAGRHGECVRIECVPPAVGYTYIFHLGDPYAESLVLQGTIDMGRFLRGWPTPNIRMLKSHVWQRIHRTIDRKLWGG